MVENSQLSSQQEIAAKWNIHQKRILSEVSNTQGFPTNGKGALINKVLCHHDHVHSVGIQSATVFANIYIYIYFNNYN